MPSFRKETTWEYTGFLGMCATCESAHSGLRSFVLPGDIHFNTVSIYITVVLITFNAVLS